MSSFHQLLQGLQARLQRMNESGQVNRQLQPTTAALTLNPTTTQSITTTTSTTPHAAATPITTSHMDTTTHDTHAAQGQTTPVKLTQQQQLTPPGMSESDSRMSPHTHPLPIRPVSDLTRGSTTQTFTPTIVSTTPKSRHQPIMRHQQTSVTIHRPSESFKQDHDSSMVAAVGLYTLMVETLIQNVNELLALLSQTESVANESIPLLARQTKLKNELTQLKCTLEPIRSMTHVHTSPVASSSLTGSSMLPTNEMNQVKSLSNQVMTHILAVVDYHQQQATHHQPTRMNTNEEKQTQPAVWIQTIHDTTAPKKIESLQGELMKLHQQLKEEEKELELKNQQLSAVTMELNAKSETVQTMSDTIQALNHQILEIRTKSDENMNVLTTVRTQLKQQMDESQRLLNQIQLKDETIKRMALQSTAMESQKLAMERQMAAFSQMCPLNAPFLFTNFIPGAGIVPTMPPFTIPMNAVPSQQPIVRASNNQSERRPPSSAVPDGSYTSRDGSFPSIWPQLPISQIQLPPTSRLPELEGVSLGSGDRIKIIYINSLHSHAKKDLEKEDHFIDAQGDTMDVIGEENMKPLINDKAMCQRMMLRYDGGEGDGVYCLPEVAALQLYLRFALRDRANHLLFDITTIESNDFGDLVDEFQHFHELQQRHSTRSASKGGATPSGSFAQHLMQYPQDCTSAERKRYRDRLTALRAADICIFPAVSQLVPRHTIREWFRRLHLFESEVDCTVFPFLAVEEKMSHKSDYFWHLMTTADKYTPLEQKLDRLKRKESKEEEESKMTDIDTGSPASAPNQSNPSTSLKLDTKATLCDYKFVSLNGHLPPTIILPSSSQLVAMTGPKREECIRDLLSILSHEVTAGGWSVCSTPTWVLKGVTPTDSHEVERWTQTSQIAAAIKRHGEIVKDCAVPQPGFLLQPYLFGYLWEAHVFFAQGEYLFITCSKQVDRSKTNFSGIDVIGGQPWARPEWSKIKPQCLDFCGHLLRLCEDYCGLVSHTPILRLDVGAEFKYCSSEANSCTEAELCQRQLQPNQWQRSGHGFIVRFFLKKVNSTLDINLYSTCTSYPIVLTAARELARHVLGISHDRLQARKLKSNFSGTIPTSQS